MGKAEVQHESGEQGTSKPLRRIEANQRRWWHGFKQAGSTLQIVSAALLAIAIGMAVVNTVDEIPKAASAIINIPGDLWLRSLRAVVLPLIVTAMILAVVRLREMSARGGAAGKLARYTILYYMVTTVFAIGHSSILVGLGWTRLFVVAGEDSLAIDTATQKNIDDRSGYKAHDIVVELFRSFVPNNIVNALATDSLLAVLSTAVVIGWNIEHGGSLMRAVEEVERMVVKVITFLIKLAPIGVFFLILSNLFRLDPSEIGINLGVLIGGSLTGIFFHLFVVLPLIFLVLTRSNPWTYWVKNSPAWVTAWGTASSAATLSVTMTCLRNSGIPDSVVKFTAPLGCLINMDGTAIYFPVVVVFMAATQGHVLNAGDYVLICLLSTLASVGASPIPSSSLVLTVMICTSIGVPMTGMFAVVVAIDWFIDRFRTALNVSSDLYAAKIMVVVTGFTEEDFVEENDSLDGPETKEKVQEVAVTTESRV